MKLSEVCCIGRGYIDGDVICKLSKFFACRKYNPHMDLIERCGLFGPMLIPRVIFLFRLTNLLRRLSAPLLLNPKLFIKDSSLTNLFKSGFRISILWFWSNSANFNETKTNVIHLINDLAIFIHASS